VVVDAGYDEGWLDEDVGGLLKNFAIATLLSARFGTELGVHIL
jgi:hypothetical protein